MAKKKKEEKKPNVHKELDGFSVEINSFGEVVSNLNVDDINKFLDKNVEDKKLTDREDFDPEKYKASQETEEEEEDENEE